MMIIICCAVFVLLIVVLLTSINVQSASQNKEPQETILRIESKDTVHQPANKTFFNLDLQQQDKEKKSQIQAMGDEAFRKALQSFQGKQEKQTEKMKDGEYRGFLRKMAKKQQ
ncbi:hypothetical protein [Niallia sp. NCCP-28]|uniref:hypothetical protein n=1 Tax=Niallia sp. NCCP-28 TaxID=2934712 RepID=UPI0020871EC5|nr:hypothetical protein [Niallia sp. NCCP-28]GKU82195.1 hypothetical protein NCCP28_15910 [Niallia sp. NCCP-28]